MAWRRLVRQEFAHLAGISWRCFCEATTIQASVAFYGRAMWLNERQGETERRVEKNKGQYYFLLSFN